MTRLEHGADAAARSGEAAPPGSGLVVHFLGTVTPRDDLDRLAALDRYPHTPGNELQWNYVEALRGAGLAGLHVFAAPAVSEYPRFPRLLVSGARLGLRRDAGIRFLPFVNVAGIKQLTQLATALAAMAPVAWRRRRSRSVVLVYSLQSPFLLAALVLRRWVGSRAVAIVPDLAEYMHVSASRQGLRATLKALDVRLGRALLARFDAAVVVTRWIATDRLRPGMPHLVVDSIRDPGPPRADGPAPAGRAVLYSGVLDAEYGVRTLLDAFASLPDPGCELWLAGKGSLEAEIRDRASRDPRIRFLGHLPLSELRPLQARASLLVSVKPAEAPFTRYSFPSKITEYLASGRPVASTACPGIDEAYFRFVHRLDDGSPDAMRRSIEAIFALDPAERERRARAGVAFLRETRAPAVRGKELAAFLEGL